MAHVPYCFDQPVTRSQSSFAVKSRMLPMTGSGFGPGGTGRVLRLVERDQA